MLNVQCSVQPQVVLSEHLDPAAEDAAEVTAFLERRVEAMVKKGLTRRASPKAPKLPLVRLRVPSRMHASNSFFLIFIFICNLFFRFHDVFEMLNAAYNCHCAFTDRIGHFLSNRHIVRYK